MSDKGEKRAELTEHLAELRARLVRSFVYLVVGAILGWVFYDFVFDVMKRPMMPVVEELDTKFLFTTMAGPFFLRMQISLISGVIAALPLITYELWSFVSPGLTASEKKPLRWIVPLSILLFIAGVALGYIILPMTFGWFSQFLPANSELRPDPQKNVFWSLKFVLAFGLMFELPVVLMLLAKLGIINSSMLKENWRVAVVGVAVLSAVVTPSGDAMTMLVMCIPVVCLYFLSIGLVRMVEAKPSKQ